MPSLPTIQPEDVAIAEGAATKGQFDALADSRAETALVEYLLRLGDDSLILGQRLTEWCGHAPSVEVDLSLANLSLDLIGQATLLLELAGEIEGRGRDADALAFHRDVLAYRNCLMVEQPNGDFAQTIARHFLFTTFQVALYEQLAASSNDRLAAIAAKAIKELRYHVDLSADWVVRLGDGTDESRQRMIDGLDWHWRFVEELFQMDDVEQTLAGESIAVDRAALRPAFDAAVERTMAAASLPSPTYPRAVLGGRKGHHSEHLGHLLAIMQYVPRTYPDARW
ncbi:MULTISPECIES: 1,2-phenylacetyl-CoA epoxidase subunit PaaC [unclassified Sphingobium]|uniref:1,2-phenylacetyl-CoA epoxidase subunit PaaC n=1 Tax=unclassified Sphingobium TaxID=2611147 RepID=UPI000D15485D|nr:MULTISPECIES: 1,2-phenylacetyl-CoA epoxidase subunit PaaC [unclassified Sphingobium]MBG6120425.1 ring-1,2-phenylacetyl-CoA epoxidase subunit PaaC [Sphingobium sp. JAI105]PSO10023.1 phenylacetate-CoA oxygenase subunit PaaI [Sphingobium sp. AEW4]TWC98917.1 ring-1,2-phenylacetyl-CoA epoxidase subunit PaaC [Sphingobium sp. AEW010]TWD18396.1 ring-1,2-phenylacetyl-CoA epoxidase subunit PaaC [Sphingobium sp. AEW013]TWD21024.1 ring-1,2-phenylacetyl-CoA epoxidase subunit PaaC [Sphingobium sp. AEW001